MLAQTSIELTSTTHHLGLALEQANQIISILEEENKRLQWALTNFTNAEIEPVYDQDIFRIDGNDL